MAVLYTRIVGRKLPGLRWGTHKHIHVGLQRGTQVVSLVPGDTAEAVFDFTLDVVTDAEGALDFRGRFAHGKRGARFLYLSWGDVGPDDQVEMFRCAKFWLTVLDQHDIVQALENNTTLEAHLDLTDEQGGPVCASVRPPLVAWRLASAMSA